MHPLIHALSIKLTALAASALGVLSILNPVQPVPVAPVTHIPAGIEIAYSAPVPAAFPVAPSAGEVLGDDISAAVTHDEIGQRFYALRQDIAVLAASLAFQLSPGQSQPSFITASQYESQIDSIYKAISRSSSGGIADFSSLTAADIPALDYLSLTGGTLTGALEASSLTSTATSTFGGLALSADCSSRNNGGKLTTDASGNVICEDDTASAGGSGSPGGSSTQVQFNDAGSFGGDAGFTYSKTADRLTVGFASTTGISTGYASTTNLVVSGISNALLKTVNGVVTAAVAGTDYQAAGNYATFAYPFPSNATSTNITFSGGLTGALTGNASTATALQTGRTINGVTFDGTSNITVTAASSTLLANSNTFSGTNTFSNTIAGSITGNAGTVTNGVYTTTFNGLFAGQLAGTTTDALAEGSANLYFTTARATANFVSNLAGTSSVASIVTLPSLSLPSSQVTGLAAYPFPSNATSTSIAFNGGLTASSATISYASTTAISGATAQFTTASSTNLVISGIAAASTQCLQINSSGTVSGTGSACGSGSGGISQIGPAGQLQSGTSVTIATSTSGSDFTVTASADTITFNLPIASASNTGKLSAADWGVFNNKISSSSIDTSAELASLVTNETGSGALVFGTSATLASTTLSGNTLLSSATTTSLGITGITASLLKTLSSGAVVAAVAGTDYQAAGNYATFSYPFPSNATSTLLAFSGGLTSYASTTIGSGAATGGLTVSGAATTTGTAYFGGNVGLGVSAPAAKLDIAHAGGIKLSNGLYSGQLKSSDSSIGLDGLVVRLGDDSGYGSLTFKGMLSAFNTVISSGGGFMSADLSQYRTIANKDDLGTIVTASGGQYSWSSATGFGFSGVADTGLSRLSAGVVKATNGSTGLGSFIASTVGIGTTSPGSILSVNGVANFTAATSTFYGTGGLNLAGGCFAVSGTCLSASSLGASTFSYLFPSNATSTLIAFNGGLTAYASTTIGNGTTTGGLTISGNATTTGKAYFNSVISAPTANYWSDTGPVNNVGIGGRLFIGSNYRNTGDKNTLGLYLNGVASWIDGEATMGYYDTRSQLGVLSGQGRVAIAASSRSSDNVDESSSDTATIGVAAFALNNGTSTVKKSAWAFYGHATHLEDNRFTTAMELDTNSYKPLVNVSPYLMGSDGTTAGMWLGVGGEDAAYVAAGNTYHGYTADDIHPVSVALGIVNSVSSIADNVFAKGIVIQDGALLEDANSRSIWAQIADGQMLDFKYGGGASSTVGQMFSEANGGSPNNQTHLVFAKTGFEIRGVKSTDYMQENKLLQLVAPATSGETNYFQLTPGVAGSSAVTFAATGTDSTVNISLMPKGSGGVGIGTSGPLGTFDAASTRASGVGGIGLVSRDTVNSNSNPFIYSYKVGGSGGAAANLGLNVYINSSGTAGQRINSNKNGWAFYNDTRSASDANFDLQQVSSGGTQTTVATFATDGSFGVGTSSPFAKLSVTGNAVLSGSSPYLYMHDTGTNAFNTIQNSSGAMQFNTGAGNSIVFQQSGSEVARFLSSTGAFGIGTTSPSQPLSVAGNAYVSGGLGIGMPPAATGGLYFNRAGNDPFFSWYESGTNVGQIRADATRGGIYFADTTGGTTYFQVNTSGSGAGNVGVGTTSPSSKLTIWGSDAASSTLAFNIANSASSTVFAVFNGGNAQLSGTLTQSSDQRLKTNVEGLDASTTLAALEQLDPVTFNWIDRSKGDALQIGFIAQDVQKLFPDLVSTTSPTALTPNGTLGVNYIGFIAPIIKGIQALSEQVRTLAAVVTGFADSFTSREVHATDHLCVGNTCVTEAQLQRLLANEGMESSSPSPSSPAPEESSEATSTPSFPEADDASEPEAAPASEADADAQPAETADSTETGTDAPPAEPADAAEPASDTQQDEPAAPAGDGDAGATETAAGTATVSAAQ